jgi:hypothetical protein
MLRLATGLLLIFLVFSSAAAAEKRVALVIGNSAYTKVPKLENPKNDAAAMEAMLKAAGFDTVVRANDLGVAAMRRALRNFSDISLDADVAVVFYAGHGMEVGGINYLIPTDAVLERDIDAQDEAVSLDRVTQILEPAKLLRLVILDACRDNPFVRSMRRTVATRAIRSGYGEIDERSLPPNTLVAYAQRAGATAADGAGPNSPYTTALLKHLPTPGLDIELALRRVRDDVLKLTRNKQEPFKYGSLGGAEIALVAARTSSIATTSPSATLGSLFTERDRQRLNEIATRNKFAAMPQFKIERPDNNVPNAYRKYVGIWASEIGFDGGVGRHAMVVVTDVDIDGQVIGYYIRGSPSPKGAYRDPASFLPFSTKITNDGLNFVTPGDWTTTISFAANNRLFVVQTHRDRGKVWITLVPVWRLVEAERSAKR